MKKFALGLCAALATSVAPLSFAATTWTFTGNSDACPSGASTCAWGNTRTGAASVPGVTVTAQAWSNTKGTGTTQLETGYLAVYSGGLGVKNRDGAAGASPNDTDELASPEHSVDSNGRYDSVLFSFSQAVTLSSLTLGWTSVDSDVTIMAYTGFGVPVLDGKTFSNLSVANGWTAIGNYSDVTTTAVNAGKVSSSYWLIGAYNPNLINSGWTAGNDYFKILSLSGTATPPNDQGVPEPSSLLLVGAVLVGLVARRKVTR